MSTVKSQKIVGIRPVSPAEFEATEAVQYTETNRVCREVVNRLFGAIFADYRGSRIQVVTPDPSQSYISVSLYFNLMSDEDYANKDKRFCFVPADSQAPPVGNNIVEQMRRREQPLSGSTKVAMAMSQDAKDAIRSMMLPYNLTEEQFWSKVIKPVHDGYGTIMMLQRLNLQAILEAYYGSKENGNRIDYKFEVLNKVQDGSLDNFRLQIKRINVDAIEEIARAMNLQQQNPERLQIIDSVDV